jgi:hypothetical protein
MENDIYFTIDGHQVALKTEGRSKQNQALVNKVYINREKKEDTRLSITFNPFLKTKLVGVLATSLLRSGTSTVDGEKMSGARRLELAISKGYVCDDPENKKEEVIDFLQAAGHEVIVEASEYGQPYYDYRNRLNNMPIHKEKTDLHKHRMALRYTIKQFLVKLYNEWRALEQLPVSPTYAEAKLGMIHGVASTNKGVYIG